MLLLVALLVTIPLGLRAQTDVTSTYMTDPSFEKNNNTTSDISATGVIGSSDWNVTSLSYARVALFNSSSTISTFGGTTSVSNGSYYLMIRSNLDQGKTQNIRQNSDMALPKGRYSISFDYKAARVKDVSRKFVISAINSGGSTTYGSKSIDIPKQSASSSYFSGIDWTTASFEFTHESTTNTRINISCETQGTANSSSSQHTVVLLDNFVINYYNINGDVLAALIAQANSINTAKGGLSDAISAAQSVYDGINNTIAYQTTIDDAISTLKSAITTKVAGITMHHGDDLSYLIANAGFEGITAETENYSTASGKDYSVDGWILDTTCDSGQGAVLTYGSGLTVNSATIPASDNASNSGKALGLSVGWAGTQLYKTAPITLPAGKYNLKVYSYNAGTNTTLTSKFGFAPTSSAATLSTKTSYTKNEWGSEEVTIELASATEGCFQLGGVAASGGSGNTAKVFFDNVTLTYINELAEAQEQWQAVHDALALLDETALPDAAEDAITTELAKPVPTTTVAAVNEAKTALQALIDSYDEIKAAYDKVNALITLATNEKDNSAGDADAKSTLATAISTATTNIETRTTAASLIDTDYATLETARQTYVTSGAEPADGYPFECTFKIVNPSFEQDGSKTNNYVPTGWTVPNKGSDYGPRAKGSMTGVNGNCYFNNWKEGWADLNIEQSISSLPKGKYTVSAVLASYSETQANLEVSGKSVDVNMTGENNGISASVTTTITNGENINEASLTIRARAGRKNWGGTNASLLRVDNFTMSYYGYKPVLNNLITSATALTTANVGDGAFQIPTSAKTTFEGAIAAAQAVYDNAAAYGTTIQTAIDDLNLAIETFQGAVLNTPLEATPYNLYLSDGGASYAKTLTFKDGNAEAGTYAIGLTEDAGSAFNQVVHFKAVAGETNQYNIYIEDAAGTKYYLCTGNGGGYAGGTTEQIRVTTDDTKALAVLLVASNTEDGVYYLKNTESSNALIGTSDGGFYTTTKYNKFNINAATQCEVPVAVNSGKWGTRIFPFEVASIPDGLEAYTTSSVSGSAIVLSDALSSIPANTPVLLKAAKDVDTSVSGYGVAKSNSYTSGLLTGVYTAATIAASVEPGAETEGAYRYVLQTPTEGVNEGVQAFYKVKSDFTATAYRCYMTVPVAATGGGAVKAFFFDFGDTDAVKSIDATEKENSVIYNLAGQRVSKAQKGLYIVNGKKVVIK